MTLRAREYGLPSTLATVIGQVRAAFGDMGDATTIMIGKAYLSQNGVGSGPRVLFVPEQRPGRIGPPMKMGNAASISHGCMVYVRAPETGDDLTRLDTAILLADRVIDCVATAAPGRIAWGDYGDDSPTDNDAFGADIELAFSYRRDIRHDEARWSLPPAVADNAAAIPVLPPGIAAVESTVEINVVPKE